MSNEADMFAISRGHLKNPNILILRRIEYISGDPDFMPVITEITIVRSLEEARALLPERVRHWPCDPEDINTNLVEVWTRWRVPRGVPAIEKAAGE